MAIYSYSAETGLVDTDTSTIRDEVVSEYRSAFYSDMNVDSSTPQGTLVNSETEARAEVMRICAQVANQFNPTYAGGAFLDAITSLMLGERRQSTASVTYNVKLTGKPGAVIPEGAKASTSSGQTWSLEGGVTLDSSGSGVGIFSCDTLGAITLRAGELNTVASTLDGNGWETVSNPYEAVVGAAPQSDAALRRYRINTLGKNAVSVIEAINSRVWLVSGVRSVSIRENTGDAWAVIDGVNMRPHSIWCCVDGGKDASVAQALYETKTIGAAWNGGTSVTVTDQYSKQVSSVQFQRATAVPIRVNVTVRAQNTQGDIFNAIRQLLVKYSAGELDGFEGFSLSNKWVSPPEMAAAISTHFSGVFVLSIEARRGDDAESKYHQDAFTKEIWEMPFLSADAITVTLNE